MNNFKYILVVEWIFLSLVASGQKDSIIALNADKSDKYTLVFKSGNFDILVGYHAFIKSKVLDSEHLKGSTQRYIDSIKMYKDTIYLNVDSISPLPLLTEDIGRWTNLNDIFYEGVLVIKNLMDSGNVRIYNRVTKKYLNKLVRKKEKRKHKESWGYGHESIKEVNWVYRDYTSHEEIFESSISFNEKIKERLPREVQSKNTPSYR